MKESLKIAGIALLCIVLLRTFLAAVVPIDVTGKFELMADAHMQSVLVYLFLTLVVLVIREVFLRREDK